MKFVHLVLGLVVACAVGLGCASHSSANAEDEEVSGSPPPAEEDSYGTLPAGPEVQVGGSDSSEQVGLDEGAADEDAEVVSRAEVRALVEKGPSYALTKVQVEPSRSEESFEGFRIVSMHPDARRAIDGKLKEGDVITHLNGVRLEKPDDYFDAWQSLADAERIRIDLLRGGEPQQAVWRVD